MLLLILLVACPLYGMHDNAARSSSQLDVWKKKAIHLVRIKTGYDASQVPEGFDEKSCGEIIQYNAQQQCAVTHIGTIYHCDEINGWHCVFEKDKKSVEVAESDLFKNNRSREDVYRSVLYNTYSSFAYSPSSKILMYAAQLNIYNLYEWPRSYRAQNELTPKIVVYGNGKCNETSMRHHICDVALNRSGHKCAMGLKSEQYDLMVTIGSAMHPINCIVHVLKDAKGLTNGMIEDIGFVSDNTLRCRVINPDAEAYQYLVDMIEETEVKKPCTIDCGNHNSPSLAMAYSYPHLYKQLIKNGYRFHITDPRLVAFMGIIYNPHLGVIPDVVGRIGSLWYQIDTRLFEQTHLEYGSNDAHFSQKDKHAFNILCLVREAGADKVIKSTHYKKDDLFYAAQRGKEWQRGFCETVNNGPTSSYGLLNALFDSCRPECKGMLLSSQTPSIKKFNLDQGKVIVDIDGSVVFNDLQQRRHEFLHKSFAYSYYYSDVCNWSQESAQQYIQDKTIESLQNKQGYIHVTLHDGSAVSLQKLGSVWHRRPEHLGSYPKYYTPIMRNGESIKVPIGSTWHKK